MGVNSLPETVTRQRRDCDLKPGPSAPESSTLTTRLTSHPLCVYERQVREVHWTDIHTDTLIATATLRLLKTYLFARYQCI